MRIEEIPIPALGPDDVLIKIEACGTQDGDHQLINGMLPLSIMPITIGHEPTGIVFQVGENVKKLKEGDRVYADPTLSCNNCPQCQDGNEVYCESFGVMGMTCFTTEGRELFSRYGNGGFAQYMKVPATNARMLPDEIPFDQAAKIAFLGVALKAIERARLRPGETVIVNGASGALGMCAVMGARALGASSIIAVARSADRLKRVKDLHPETINVLSVSEDPSMETVKDLTRGNGADVLIDCLPRGIETTRQAIMRLRKGGRAVLLGGVSGPIDVDYRYFMLSEVEITGSVGMGRCNFPRIFEMVRKGVIDLSGFVTHRFPLKDANEAIETVIEKTGDPLGVIITP